MALPRLLLIDDEPALAAFVAKAADMCGFAPVIAEQDQEFRESFHEQRPKMVVLDLGMPGMDGVELLRFLADEELRRPRADHFGIRSAHARTAPSGLARR